MPLRGPTSKWVEGTYELKDHSVHVLGDAAYETGTEHVSGKLGGHLYRFASRVTNIYRREGEGWKMVHHHSEVSPAILELLQKLQRHQAHTARSNSVPATAPG